MIKKSFIPILVIVLMGILFFASAESYSDGSVCCEVSNDGGICVNEDSFDSCSSENLSSYTSCDSTSYCKLGTCYDSEEGICMAQTPKAVCEEQGFVWDERDESQIPQCQLGCCLISDQVAFTTLTRCRVISKDFGIPINYRSDIDTELECVALALGQDEGACVYESDYQLMCERTTRDECDALGSVEYYDGEETTLNPLEDVEKTFYKDVLCSSEKLGTICTPQANTGCYDGQVYWYDSCGNRENVVYTDDLDSEGYRDLISANIGDSGYSFIAEPDDDWYGACDVFESTICDSKDNPNKFIQHECRDTYCVEDDGTVRLNGESWCVADDDSIDVPGGQSAGTRSYRQMCIDGEIIIEACDPYRSKICYEDEIDFENSVSVGGKTISSFSSAACIVNRWQDCISIDNQDDCDNYYQRDCVWVANPPTGITLSTGENGGTCLPEYAPGTEFWETSGEEQCSLGSATCVVEYEGLLVWRDENFVDNTKDKNIVNAECLTDEWVQEMNAYCASFGDCGGNVNYIGDAGFGGYEVKDYEFVREGEDQTENFTIRDLDESTIMEKISRGLAIFEDD